MSAFRKFARRLRRSTSGNTALLVGLGMPALIGGAGVAVDTAQWYLWQRELQYAADQAALAGAWARGNGDTSNIYQTRATQEFTANLQVTDDYSPTHSSALADYGTGTQNSVVVTASVTASLPFSEFVMGRSATVSVRSQAIWETTDEYTACLMALHPTTGSALWFNGGPTVNVGCEVASLSTASNAIRTNGSGGAQNITAAVAAGGVSDGMGAFANGEIIENSTSLKNPFEGLTPPDYVHTDGKSLSCASASASYTADETVITALTYTYYRGRNANKAENDGPIVYSGAKPNSSSTSTTYGNTYTSSPTGGTSTTSGSLNQVSGSGADKIYEQVTETVTTSYANVVLVSGSTGAMQPGIYTDFEISCDTTLASGIYTINGGRFKLNGGNKLVGTGVMFILKGGAEVDINGGAEVFLSPMTALELINLGVPTDDAGIMEGMLIFEDPASAGNSGSKFNGSANFDINGIIYMPKSDLQLAGNMGATADCLMIMSSTLKLSGTADLQSFCPPGDTHDVVVGESGTRVRLVG